MAIVKRTGAAAKVQEEEKIEVVPIAAVKLWKENPRQNDKAVPRLMEIIKQRGQVTPIVVWRKNGVIYKGNTTYKAIKRLGWGVVKVLYRDFPSEAAAVAYGIDDNLASEWSGWDDDLLSALMQAPEVQTGTAFTEKERASVLMNVDGFASQTFAEAAEEFGAKVAAAGKKKKAFWFWFEVDTEEEVAALLEAYSRIEGKRLHRELSWDKLKERLVEYGD